MTANAGGMHGRGRTVVIGVGNEFRRDDGAGPAVIARLRGQLPGEVALVVSDGDPVRLIEAWSGATLAVVVDAVRAHPPHPGRLRRFVVDRPGRDPGAGAAGPGAGTAGREKGLAGRAGGRAASTHGLGLDDAIGLAHVLERMPDRMIVHAIEVADVTHGADMTPAVAAAVAIAAAAVRRDVLSPP